MNRAGGAVVRFCRMTRTKWGLRAPTPRGTFLYGQKGTKKPPGEGPRSPRHRPPGDTPFVVYLRSDRTGLILLTVHPLRLPLPIVYPRILSEAPAVAHWCGDSRHCACGPTTARAMQAPPYCAATRSDPPCRLYPFNRASAGVIQVPDP